MKLRLCIVPLIACGIAAGCGSDEVPVDASARDASQLDASQLDASQLDSSRAGADPGITKSSSSEVGSSDLGPLERASASRSASSRDYPGPCQGEQTVPGTPQYLSADYKGRNPDVRAIVMPATGRFRLGISCVGTGYFIIRIGADSALCQARGKCTQDQLATVRSEDIDWVRQNFPDQVPFSHTCNKHGFGWYDSVSVQPGTYLAIAGAGSGFRGLVDGHGTMDTYAYTGNGGSFQPVNCAAPVKQPSCGDQSCNGSETCDSCSTDCGACPSAAPYNCYRAPLDLPLDTPLCARDTKKSCLIMQSDGNLVVYDEAGRPRFASNTAGRSGNSAVFQSDGNLVVYGSNRKPLWASNSSGTDPAKVNYLCTQGDGNVVVYRWPRAVWASNTNH